MIIINDAISKEELYSIGYYIEENSRLFADGKKTAGWQAKSVKNNEQLSPKATAVISKKAEIALRAHALFSAAAMPKTFVSILVSRYRPGMEYGLHVDDALMGGTRTDLSFTLFLNDPQTYEGGELVIEGNDATTEIKLEPGSLVLYPTTTLHRVAPVTSGERLAIVGWVRSFIRGSEQREALFDLEQALAAARQHGLPREAIDRMLKLRANLIRLWAED